MNNYALRSSMKTFLIITAMVLLTTILGCSNRPKNFTSQTSTSDSEIVQEKYKDYMEKYKAEKEKLKEQQKYECDRDKNNAVIFTKNTPYTEYLLSVAKVKYYLQSCSIVFPKHKDYKYYKILTDSVLKVHKEDIYNLYDTYKTECKFSLVRSNFNRLMLFEKSEYTTFVKDIIRKELETAKLGGNESLESLCDEWTNVAKVIEKKWIH